MSVNLGGLLGCLAVHIVVILKLKKLKMIMITLSDGMPRCSNKSWPVFKIIMT